jgi:amino acid transporter
MAESLISRRTRRLIFRGPLWENALVAENKGKLGVRDLTLFALTCVVSARWIPLAAHAGPTSVTLWILAAVFFVAPLTVAVAVLVAKDPSAGGLYRWTRNDFGAWHGFFCAWVYWIGIAFLFPTAAMLYARVVFSLLRPNMANLGDSRPHLLTATLALIWTALAANLLGLKVGKWAENIGALATLTVGGVLVTVAWLTWARRGSATPMHIVPAWNWGTISFWAAIAYATSGMEGAGAMASQAADPERTMRRAGWLASVAATMFYVSATFAFLVILPPDRITELNGYADTAESAGRLIGASWLSPVIAVLVLVGGVGFLGGIGTASSQLPFAAGADGLLPKAFGRLHSRWGSPHVSILALGLLATFLLIVYQLGDSMKAAYNELVSLMVITGFIPYLYIFGSAWKAGKRLSALSGAGVTLLALVAAAVPPDGTTSIVRFEGKLAAGTIGVMLAAWLVYRSRSKWRQANALDTTR